MLDVVCWRLVEGRSFAPMFLVFNQHPKSNIKHPSIMARRRFFVDEVRRGEATLEGEDAEHLTRVLRVEVGQRYEISDGARLYLSEIVEARNRSGRFHLIEGLPAVEPTGRIYLV